jgi:hypothetical protein
MFVHVSTLEDLGGFKRITTFIVGLSMSVCVLLRLCFLPCEVLLRLLTMVASDPGIGIHYACSSQSVMSSSGVFHTIPQLRFAPSLVPPSGVYV